jgi:hypothetical protein
MCFPSPFGTFRCNVVFGLLAALMPHSFAQVNEAAPSPGPGNLLRNTRLVEGLPSGWTITGRINNPFSEGEDVKFQTDATVPGPSGYPAFLVDVIATDGVPSSYGWQQSVLFFSEPFKVPTDGVYTASVYIKGSGTGSIGIVPDNSLAVDGPVVAIREFAIEDGDDWKRITCTFDASAKKKLYGIRFKLDGKFWFDGFQVNAGREPSPYQSALPAEVALQAEGGDLESVRMQFADENPLIRWTVTGAQAGNVLAAKVVDLNGTAKNLPEIALKGEASESGTIDYAMPELNSLGQFRIEAVVKNHDGDHASMETELVMTRVKRPKSWGKDNPESPFGIHIQPTHDQILMAKAFGMNWVRLHDAGVQLVGWAYLEKEAGKWNFFEKELARYRKGNLLILGQLGTAPQWKSKAAQSTVEPPAIEQTVCGSYFEPSNLEDFADYTRRVAERYRDYIQYFDIWNEPWHPFFFAVDFTKTQPATMERAAKMGESWFINSSSAPEEFAKLQKTAFDALHEANKGFQLVGMGTHGSPVKDGRYPGDVWTKRMVESGAMKTLDDVGFHAYTSGPIGFPGDSIDEEIKTAVGYLGGVKEVHASGHQLWMTEGSPIPRKTTSGFYRLTLPYKDGENYWDSSDRIVRFLTRFLSEGVDKVFLYSMDATNYFGQRPRARVFVNEDGYPHPSGAAAANTTWNLEGTRFRSSFELKNGKATGYVFDGADSSVILVCPRPGKPMVAPDPEGLQLSVEDIFGNPLRAKTSRYSIWLKGDRKDVDGFVAKSAPTPTP